MTRKFVEQVDSALWSDAWTAESCAKQQHEHAFRELQKWLNGSPHVAFDAFVGLLNNCCPPPKRLLEIGCGAGYYCKVTEVALPDCQYFGMDFSFEMIATARRHYPRGTFVCGQAECLVVEPASFDCVVLGSVIGCCNDWKQAIQESIHVSSGYLIVHRVAVHSNPELPDVRDSIKEAYGVTMAERIIKESVLLDFIDSQGCCKPVSSPVIWSKSDDGFQASYLFEVDHDSLHHDVRQKLCSPGDDNAGIPAGAD